MSFILGQVTLHIDSFILRKHKVNLVQQFEFLEILLNEHTKL